MVHPYHLLTIESLKKFYISHGEYVSTEDLIGVMKRIDFNKNGKINVNDFCNAMSPIWNMQIKLIKSLIQN